MNTKANYQNKIPTVTYSRIAFFYLFLSLVFFCSAWTSPPTHKHTYTNMSIKNGVSPDSTPTFEANTKCSVVLELYLSFFTVK